MATKKSKKPANVLAFNKANAKLFADNIFSDKHGRVTFLKLCDGELSNGKDGNRTLHCALGEAYFTFVDTNVAKFIENTVKKFGETTDDNQFHDEKDWYTPKYSNPNPNITHIPTLAVADALVEVAQLRNQKLETKKNLAQALLTIMEVNDDSCGLGIGNDAERSRDVAETWRTKVIPLLK